MKKTLSDFFHKGDMVLLSLCLAASFFGLALIYTATRYMNTERYVVVQAIGIFIGVICYMVLTLVDMELFTERTWWALAIFGVAIILALIPLGVGEKTTGNKNWIPIPGLPINIQPTEVAKIAYVILMAYQCAKLKERGVISHPLSVMSLGGHALIMGGLALICTKGDFGSFLLYVLIYVIITWCAGVGWWWFALQLGAAVGLVAALWGKLPGYIRGRISVVFLRNDPTNAGWQQEKSVLAIGSGGLTGQGFLKGTQTQRGGIISQHADEIFAVCGEELGMVGCAVMILLLAAIIARCFWIGHKAHSPMSALMAMGFGGMFLAQTAVNIAMCLYIFPVVGLALPFFSYGGTSIIVLFIAAGLVSGVKARDLPSWLQDRGG